MNDTPRTYDWISLPVMLCALLTFGIICLHLVVTAYGIDLATGVRSTAGILLPLVVGGFLAVFRRDLFAGVANLRPQLAFALALAFGVVVMLLLRNIVMLRFAPVAESLAAREEVIVGELNGAQGSPQDLGGYYRPDPARAERAMRPSQTFNDIIDSL